VRYGAWLDQMEARRHPDGAALTLAEAADRVEADAWAAAFDQPRPRHPPLAAQPIRLDDRPGDARGWPSEGDFGAGVP
jgi:hypothetical protein